MQISHDGDTTLFFKSILDAKEHNPCAMVVFDGDEYTSFFCKADYPSVALELQDSHEKKEEAYNLCVAYVNGLKALDKDQSNQVT